MIKKTTIYLAIIIGIIFIGFTACEDAHFFEGELTSRVSYLYLDYWNPDTTADGTYGDVPQIALDEQSSSKAVKIDFTKDFKGVIENQRSKIIIDNLRVIDDYGNFEIKQITVEEFKENVWQPQSLLENPVTFAGVQSLDVVLVLDASASMTPNFNYLKSSAKRFIDKVKAAIPNAKIGIVSFANEIITYNLSAEASQAKLFIDAMQPTGQETRLYSAMIQGIGVLKNSTAESKVLVTFTDGADTEEIHTSDTIVKLLNEQTQDFVKIQSYVIGLKGDIDIQETVLKQMAVRGFALFPTSGKELEEFFDYFSRVVFTVYNLTYSRTTVKIPEDSKRRIRFKLETIQR